METSCRIHPQKRIEPTRYFVIGMLGVDFCDLEGLYSSKRYIDEEDREGESRAST